MRTLRFEINDFVNNKWEVIPFKVKLLADIEIIKDRYQVTEITRIKKTEIYLKETKKDIVLFWDRPYKVLGEGGIDRFHVYLAIDTTSLIGDEEYAYALFIECDDVEEAVISNRDFGIYGMPEGLVEAAVNEYEIYEYGKEE